MKPLHPPHIHNNTTAPTAAPTNAAATHADPDVFNPETAPLVAPLSLFPPMMTFEVGVGVGVGTERVSNTPTTVALTGDVTLLNDGGIDAVTGAVSGGMVMDPWENGTAVTDGEVVASAEAMMTVGMIVPLTGQRAMAASSTFVTTTTCVSDSGQLTAETTQLVNENVFVTFADSVTSADGQNAASEAVLGSAVRVLRKTGDLVPKQVVVPAEANTVDTSGPTSNSWPGICAPACAKAPALDSMSTKSACLQVALSAVNTAPKETSTRVRWAPTLALAATPLRSTPTPASVLRTRAAVMLAERLLSSMGRRLKSTWGLVLCKC